MCSVDQERARYLRALTGHNWLDASQYHLSLDTSAVGMEKAENIILEALKARVCDVEIKDNEVVGV